MAKVKSWKVGDPAAPAFPTNYEIRKKAVLQVTDIKNNNNKYYSLELHVGKIASQKKYRVYTHYGRTDDLERDPNSGQKECRYLATLGEAEETYASLYAQKTSARKGYREVSLASSNIGSEKARGTSSGQVDAQTLEKLAAQDADKKNSTTKKATKKAPTISLEPGVQQLVRYIYDEATNALTTTVQAKITAQGIETPLGILTLGQIERGEEILQEAFELFQKKSVPHKQQRLEDYSSQFYTAIPHRLGRSRAAVQAAVLDSLSEFEQKQNTLQLMRDMLQVNGEEGDLLHSAEVQDEYQALKCKITAVPAGTEQYQELEQYLIKSLVKTKKFRLVSLYQLDRLGENDKFTHQISNQRLLFHGSRIQNWVGILSRGILLPKIVVSMGVNRTDAGWLGHGIYFGDAACTSAFYATAGRRKTKLMAIAQVALGKMKKYHKITYGLSGPPTGYDSCHGVRGSEFDDDEYVVYTDTQQKLAYLAEFAA